MCRFDTGESPAGCHSLTFVGNYNGQEDRRFADVQEGARGAVTLTSGRTTNVSELGSPYFRLNSSPDCQASVPLATRNPAMLKSAKSPSSRLMRSASRIPPADSGR